MTSRVASALSPLVPEIVALLGGIVSAVIIALPLNTFLGFVSAENILLAPVIEEPAKATGLIFLALTYPDVISTKVRGLILGGLAGLGFAYTENLFYATMPQTDVVARAVFPVPMHVMASGVVGLGLVYLAQNRIETRKNDHGRGASTFSSRNVGSLMAVAMVMHGQYNFFSYFGYAGSVVGLAIAGFVCYQLGRALPENLKFFTVPGPVGLLTSTVHVKVLTRTVPPPRIISVTLDKPEQQTWYCINCGQRISLGAAFCEGCGALQR
jgi:RsiW-degrading membrane proteinase PrsW (M82 family)